jgi:hypothetical protein
MRGPFCLLSDLALDPEDLRHGSNAARWAVGGGDKKAPRKALVCWCIGGEGVISAIFHEDS